MSVNLEHVEASSRRFHKTATLLAEKCSNNSAARMDYYPVLLTKGSSVWAITSSNNKPDSEFYTPYIVNAALSLEILLKWTIFIEKEVWVRGHNLAKLFEQLSPNTIKTANSKFNELCKLNPKYKEIQKTITKEASISFHWGLASILSKSSQSFEHWRYAFEAKNKCCFLCYGEIYETLLYTKKFIEGEILE